MLAEQKQQQRAAAAANNNAAKFKKPGKWDHVMKQISDNQKNDLNKAKMRRSESNK